MICNYDILKTSKRIQFLLLLLPYHITNGSYSDHSEESTDIIS